MALPMRLRARRYAQRELSARTGAGGIGVAYLFRESWTTADDAPVTTPRTSEPGPGSITFTGTDQSIAGQRLVCPNNVGAQGWVRTDAAITKADGLAVIYRNWRRTGAITASGNMGWRTAATLGATLSGGGLNVHSTGVRTTVNGAVGLLAGALTVDVDYDFAVVCRTNGAYLLYKLSSSSSWTLLYVDDIMTSTTLYPIWQYTTTPSQMGAVVAFQSWLIPRIYYSASGVIGTVDPGRADFVAKMRCTGTAAQSLIFRRQDATNYWEAKRNTTAMELIETVAGSPTTRATAAITAAANDRIIVAAEGNTIRLWNQVAAGTTIVTPTAYASASNFATATGMAVSDEANYTELEVFPRSVSGVAA